MIPGTTPTHTFKLPFSTDIVTAARFIYKQYGKEVLRKTTRELRMGERSISADLTQEETFVFDSRTDVQIQARVRTLTGKVFSTKARRITVDECLDTECLYDEITPGDVTEDEHLDDEVPV